jgi:tetratricopeptide (TPR) repeat protein
VETRWEYHSANTGQPDPGEDRGERSLRRKLPAIFAALIAVMAMVAIVAVFRVTAQWRSNLTTHEDSLTRGEDQHVRDSESPTPRGLPTPGLIDADGTPPQSADGSQVAASRSPYHELPTSQEACLETLRQEAAETGREVVEALPGSPEPLALQPMIHNRFGHSEEAAKCWQRCLDLDPDYADAHDGLGTVALEAGNYEEAAVHFRKALELNPSLRGVRAALADALMSTGQTPPATDG